MPAKKEAEKVVENAADSPAVAAGIDAGKPARITRFLSHKLPYFRVTLPREYGERFCNDLNLYSTSIDAETGAVTFTPIRPLIPNTAPLYAVENAVENEADSAA